MGSVKRWTKKDIKSLQQQLTNFVLSHEMYYSRDRIRDVIEKHRQQIVVGGIKGFRSLIADREQSYRDSIEHAKKNPTFYSADHQERFTELADSCAADVKKMDAMLARIEQEGLPPEVANHMPDRVDNGGTPDYERSYNRTRR